MQTLRDLFVGLRLIDAPKTLILISEGFVLNDEALIIELGQAGRRGAHQPLRAEARTGAVRDHRLRGCRSTRSPIARRDRGAGDCSPARRAARSSTSTGTGQTLFERIESEISGYYLLGVESDPKDKDAQDALRCASTCRARARSSGRGGTCSTRPRIGARAPRGRRGRPWRRRSARRCWHRRCRCASPRSRSRGRSATRSSC